MSYENNFNYQNNNNNQSGGGWNTQSSDLVDKFQNINLGSTSSKNNNNNNNSVPSYYQNTSTDFSNFFLNNLTNSNRHNDSTHISTRCDGCKVDPIVGARYKCLQCKNFDYCEECFQKNKSIHNHPFNSVIKPKVFSNVFCDGCGITPTKVRFNCNSCSNFDYCETCFLRNIHIHTHSFTSYTN